MESMYLGHYNLIINRSFVCLKVLMLGIVKNGMNGFSESYIKFLCRLYR